MKKYILLSAAIMLLALGETFAQTFIPVATIGYSLDGVAENTTAIATTGGAMDASDFVLYSQYYGTLYSTSAVGLPNNGTIVSGTRTYQLQNYTGFNVMHLLASQKDTLDFITPQAFPTISLLGFGTQGNATASITVRFTDNSTQVFNPVTLDDWFTIVSPVYSGFDRVLRSTGIPAYVGSLGNPRMLGIDLNILCANQGKLIKRVIIQNTSATAHLCVMAVAGAVPAYSVTGNPLICSGANATLNATGFSTYTWVPGGSFAGSNSGTVVVSPTSNTNYTLTGTDALGCPGYTTVSINVSSGAPVLSLSGSSQSVCLGAAATITASGALVYTLSSPAPNGIPFVPASTTIYTITGANGCGSNSLSITITVSPLPVTATAPTTLVCAGSQATLIAGGATNYTWMPGSSTQSNYVALPFANTIYTVTGKTGNCIGTNTAAISTKPLPSISITPASTAVCSGDAVNLSVSGNAITYTWSPGNQTSTLISVAPTQASLYSVIGTNSANCTSVAQQVILVNPNPTVTISASNQVICKGDASNLSASGATTYIWSTTDIGPSVVVNPVTDQTYTVTGSYTTGCSATATITIAIYSPTIAVSSNTVICEGSSANISSSGAISYTWANNNTVSQAISVSPSANTIYTVTGSVNDPVTGVICVASNTLQVTVNPSPAITASSSRTNNTICKGESVLLTGSGAGSTGTYLWTGANLTASTATANVSPFIDQNYTLLGTDANGCQNSVQLLIHVFTCTGIKTNDVTPQDIYVYPNPANSVVNLRSDKAAELVIVNELGQKVRSLSLNATNQYRTTVEGLTPGMYFVTCANIECGNGQKIVITE